MGLVFELDMLTRTLESVVSGCERNGVQELKNFMTGC